VRPSQLEASRLSDADEWEVAASYTTGLFVNRAWLQLFVVLASRPSDFSSQIWDWRSRTWTEETSDGSQAVENAASPLMEKTTDTSLAGKNVGYGNLLKLIVGEVAIIAV
jgi:hypothetical protein